MSDPVILTWSGRYISLLNPRPEDIDIGDIAAGLSKCCRFAGQIGQAYTVAQHSVLVSRLVPPGSISYDNQKPLAFAGLLHDASEAYLGDVIGPMKKAMRLIDRQRMHTGDLMLKVPSAYDLIEARWAQAINLRFGLPEGAQHFRQIVIADQMALAIEDRDLRGLNTNPNLDVSSLPSIWRTWPLLKPLPNDARAYEDFVVRFNELVALCSG